MLFPPARIPANKVDARLRASVTPTAVGDDGQGYFVECSSMKNRAQLVPAWAFSRVSLVSLAVASVFPAWSQTALKEVVVTATRSEQLQSATLAHTTVITREDIDRSQASDLVSLLQREAGLQRTQNGGIGTVSSIFMRGAPSLQTLVLIDGIPQNKQDASGAVSLEHVMLDNVERVEVVRGNVSAIYGSGAIGGVIQIFTKTGGREPSAAVSTELGPRAFRKASGAVSGGLGNTSFGLNVSRLQTDGFSAINTTQQPGANPDADGYENTSLNLTVTHRLSKDHSFGARLTKTTGDTTYDNPFGAPADIQSSTTRLGQFTLFTDNTWGNWRSRLSLGEQSDKSRSQDNGFFGSTDSFVTRATVLNWVNTIALGADWLATAGLERQHQRVDTTTTSPFGTPYGVSRNTSAAFAGIDGALGGGALQVNVRRDKVGDLQQSTGYLGYGYPLSEQFKFIASASTAFNAPPLGYLFAPGFGNPALLPERARSKELGLQYAQGDHLLRATYFDTRVSDQLTYDTATFAFANIGRTRNDGLELSYKGRVGSTDLRASLTSQEPVNAITGQALVRRARTLMAIGMSHPVGAWRLDGDLRYSGKRPDTYTDPLTFAPINTTLASYAVLDLAVSYKLTP
jgi:vitamin B12 transporter